MPEFIDPRPEWKDSEGPPPLSWRFGLYRRWNPDLNFLYEVRINGSLAWAPCLRFTDEEEVRLIVRPHHQNPEHPQPHIADCSRTSDRLQEPAEQS